MALFPKVRMLRTLALAALNLAMLSGDTATADVGRGSGDPYVVKRIVIPNDYLEVWSDGQVVLWSPLHFPECSQRFERVVVG